MQDSMTVILADYLTGRISTTEALRRSDMQAVDDLVRAVRSESDDLAVRPSFQSQAKDRRRA